MRCSVKIPAWILLFGLTGCSEDKIAPEKPTETEVKPQANPLEPTKPTKEDPAAREIVNQAIAAHTGSKPELLQKFRTHHMDAKGRMVSPTGTSFVEAEVEWWAAWPDQIALRIDQEEQTQASWALTAAGASQRREARKSEPILPREAKLIRTDSSVLVWGTYLGVLTNPDAIFHSPGTATREEKRFKSVKCYQPGQPEWILWFDEKTNLLDCIHYQALEGDIVRAKTLLFSGHESDQGVKVPKQFSLLIGGNSVFQMKVQKLETPDKFDPKTFIEPPALK